MAWSRRRQGARTALSRGCICMNVCGGRTRTQAWQKARLHLRMRRVAIRAGRNASEQPRSSLHVLALPCPWEQPLRAP